MFSFDFSGHEPLIVRLCLSLIILVVILSTRHLFSKWVIHALSHIKFHKVHLDTSSLQNLQKPIYALLSATGFYLALVISPFVANETLGNTSLHLGKIDIPLSILSLKFISKIYFASVAGILTWIAYEFELLYEQFFTKVNAELELINNTVFIRYLSRIINFITLAIGVSITLIILVPDFSGLLTGVGIGGAAIALAAKDTLASTISGMFLLLDKPFIIKDWVSIDSIEGIVEDISFRSTRIRTFTQGLVIIPNNTVSNANIINWSRMEKRRVSFELGVSYDTTPEKIKLCTNCIQEILMTFDQVEKGTTLVHFTKFGDYSLNLQIIYYTFAVPASEYLALQEQVNLEILKFCEANHIDIAFPTQTILFPNVTS